MTTAPSTTPLDPLDPIPRRHSRYLRVLAIVFGAYWVAWAIHPKYFNNWVVENTLLVLCVIFLFVTRKRFPLSNVSYTLIAVFLALHTVGAHYSYAEVPYNDWFKAVFGRPLHAGGRNMYDRLVHFTFGLLMAYPIRELFLRVARVRGFWGYYLPLDVTMSFSMLYELIEWAYAATAGGSAGASFLGTQGDEWDAQKDMAMATLGGLICMCTVAFINWRFDRNFGDEWRASLRIQDGDRPLGEVRLAELRDGTGRP
ncbi:MAG TPA: DUF2238 domain-containing protein [Tepidisphaeraceae bacterium]|jgi:putative membrane protein